MKQLVGLMGEARSGKDLSSHGLIAQLGFYKTAYADAIKEAALAINPIILESRRTGEIFRLKYFIDRFGWEEAKEDLEVRRLLQVIGTEMGRNLFGENCWIDIVDRKTKDKEKVVVTDVRLPSEQHWIWKNKGIIIKIVRPKFDNGLGEASKHETEKFIKLLKADYEIENNGTIEELQAKVVSIVKEYFNEDS